MSKKGARFSLEQFSELSKGKGVKGVELQDQKKKQVVKAPTSTAKKVVRSVLNTKDIAIRCNHIDDNRFNEVRYLPVTENTTIRKIREMVKLHEANNPGIAVREITLNIL